MTTLKLMAAACGLAVTVAMPHAADAQQSTKHYRFAMVSHIGSNDPNMKWLTVSMQEFERTHPNVKVDYVSSNQYSLQELVRLLEETIASKPDGIAVPIVSADALEGPIHEAIDAGIPVVAFNIPDDRQASERIPYMNYVGGGEYLTGYKTGMYAITKAKAGIVPMPKRVVCALIAAEHHGLRERCRGIEAAFKTVGAPAEYLFTGADPATFRSNLQAYLSAHPETNYILNMGDFTAPWSWQVARSMGRKADVGQKDMTILTVGIGPIGLSGVKEDHILVASEQGFWEQGYIPFEELYWRHELGYEPQSDVVTGPTIVDKTNLATFDKLSKIVFGSGSENDSAWK
jgi:simple sugar transport system substrate-binding protein